MNLESLILTKLGEHRWIGWLDMKSKCRCGHEATSLLDFEGHLASVITEAVGAENIDAETVVGDWAKAWSEQDHPLVVTFPPLYRLRGLESDPSEGE